MCERTAIWVCWSSANTSSQAGINQCRTMATSATPVGYQSAAIATVAASTPASTAASDAAARVLLLSSCGASPAATKPSDVPNSAVNGMAVLAAVCGWCAAARAIRQPCTTARPATTDNS